MVVASMTIEEIYKEVMTDYESLNRKAYAQSLIFQSEMKRKNLQHQTRMVLYKTRNFNEWNIMFEIYTYGIKKLFYLRTNDKRGAVTYLIQFFEGSEEKYIIKLNTHFFKRYNERLHLHLTKPADVIKHFFKYNFESELGESEELPNGTRLVHFVYAKGIGIGWENDEKKAIHIKTFIANETLNASQKSLAEYIKSHDDSEEFSTVINMDRLKDEF